MTIHEQNVLGVIVLVVVLAALAGLVIGYSFRPRGRRRS